LPLNAGMLPSALALLSAPTQVKSLPRRSTSSGAAFAVPIALHPNNNPSTQVGVALAARETRQLEARLLPVIFILLGYR
jgi:hypothetical protein